MVRSQESLFKTATPASKLRPPRVRHSELTRTAVLDDDQIEHAEVLAITAPPGYGKSTVAVQWAARTQRPVVWLTCDETDADSLVLMEDLRAAMDHGAAGYRPPPGPLTVEEPAFSRQVLPGFLSSVNALQPVTVVIDDAHLVKRTPAQQLLKMFVDALPDGSQVALVGRSLHGLALPLWRGQGRVADITAEDLTFTADETREALTQFVEGPVSDDTVRRVHETTGGWPVAVYLTSQTGSGVRLLSTIDEFIEVEVLGPMAPDLQAFVTWTAALGSVNVDLATAVTGQRRAGHFLGEAITTVLIHHTLDDWYRYHPLLQECAVRILAREDPEGLRHVRAAAAIWYLEQGHIEQAVQLALASEDPSTLGAVLWPASRILLLQGRAPTVKDWLDTVGDKTTLETPALGMTAAWTYLTLSDFGNVLRYGEATVRRMPPDWRKDLVASDIGPYLAMLLAITGQGLTGQQEATELARAAMACTPDDDPVLALSALIAGFNMALVGDPEAITTVSRAAALARSTGIASTEVEAQAILGMLHMVAGDDTAGCGAVEAAQQIYAFHDLRPMVSTTGILALAEAGLRAFRGRPADARSASAHLDRMCALLEPVFPWFRPLSGGILAFVCARHGDLEGFQRYIRWCDESESVSGGLCQRWAARARQEYAASSPLRDLSPAELRVWELLKGRMTLSEIAGALFLSRETVKTHTVSIYRKLGVSSRREAQDLAEAWSQTG